jgi:hypothetical protein
VRDLGPPALGRSCGDRGGRLARVLGGFRRLGGGLVAGSADRGLDVAAPDAAFGPSSSDSVGWQAGFLEDFAGKG